MSSVGQAVGMVVGGVLGVTAFPGVGFALGASIGGAIGGAIDPPKGPNTVGPRLDDLSYQSSAFGVPLAHAYGTVPVLGNVFWLEGDKYNEVGKKTKTGGKGGSKATAPTFTYYATFASSLFVVRDPAQTIKLRRLWIGSNLVYDASGAALTSTIASHLGSVNFTFYDGSDPQSPHPRMQADKGAANVSGYPGLCHIVVEDLDLTPYSNSLEMAQVKAEVVVGGQITYASAHADDMLLPSPIPFGGARYIVPSACFEPGKATHVMGIDNNWDGEFYGVVFVEDQFGIVQRQVSADEYHQPGNGYFRNPATVCATYSTDRVSAVLTSNVSGYGDVRKLTVIEPGGVTGHSDDVGSGMLSMSSAAVVNGHDTYLFSSETATDYVQHFSGLSYVGKSPVAYKVSSAGCSENYLFLVKSESYTYGTLTIYKLDRSTLSLVETITGTCQSNVVRICVESDTRFFTCAVGAISSDLNLWENGSIVKTWPAIMPPALFSFKVFDATELYITSLCVDSVANSDYYITSGSLTSSVAKLRDIVTSECGFSGIGSSRLDLSALTNSDVRGFRVAQSNARTALEQLQDIFPFDVTISGYKLKFVSRGGSPVATIPESDLGAHVSGESVPVLLPIAREMDSQIPATVRVKHLDPDREYDLGEQFASRPGTASVGERTVETGVVLNSTESARAADVLNQKDWTERRDYGPLTLPPTYSHLEPTDVVTVNHRSTIHNLRLTNVEYLQDGRLSCSARLTAAQSYTSTAIGVAPQVLGQSVVPLAGSTDLVLLDIPRIVSAQDAPGMAYAILGHASGWPGAAVFRSDDYGNNWQVVGSSGDNANIFIASDSLPAHHGYSVDHSALTVTPDTTGADLYSVSEDEFYAQTNLAAYGVDGRWEIVAFRTVVDNTGTFTLRDWLRGLYGTEWATGLHVAGDDLVMLDTTDIGFFTLPTTAIGVERIYRAVTQGYSIDSGNEYADTYEANNLKPLSPVDVFADRNSFSREWSFGWIPRSRWPVELFSGAVVPIGETTEIYDIEIWSSSFSSLKRTFSGLSTPSASYSESEQISDFGYIQATIYGRIYQRSSVIGRGFFREFVITRAISSDQYIDLRVLGMHMDDASLSDIEGHTITLAGGATRSATQSKFGGYAAYFNGSDQYARASASSDFDLFGGNVSIDFWAYFPSSGGNQCLLEMGNDLYNRANVSLVSGALNFYTSVPANNGTRITGTAPSDNSWHYIELIKDGSTITLRVDLVSFGTTTTTYLPSGSMSVTIGATCVNSSYYNGYIEDMRIAAAVRTTTSLPVEAFPDN